LEERRFSDGKDPSLKGKRGSRSKKIRGEDTKGDIIAEMRPPAWRGLHEIDVHV
jgi:hypothetical protein